MKKITRYSCWYVFFCLAMQWSFCGKIKSVFLERDAYSQKCDEQGSWQHQQSHEIKQPDTFYRPNRVRYDENKFGPSVFVKKDAPKSGLRRSPPSDNLCRDSHESDTQSSTSLEASSSETSRAPTPENQRLLVSASIVSSFKHPRLAATHLKIEIPRRALAEQDKPRLIATLLSSFKGLAPLY